MVGRFRRIFRTADLTDTQWRTLRVLDDHGKLSFSKLSTDAVIPKPSLSRILVNLEGRGFVSRSEQVHDLRQVDLSLTDAGKAIVESLSPLIEAEYVHISNEVGTERIDAIASELHYLIESLSSVKTPAESPAYSTNNQALLAHSSK